MRITGIDTYVLECPLERPFGWSQGWISKRETLVVKVTTDAGVAGWGESPGRAVGAVIHDLLARQALGQDALNRNALWQRMFHALYNAGNTGGIGGTAISGIDIALWDIAGKSAGLPVCQLLGGAVRDKVAVYATGLYYTEGEFPDRLLAEARGYVDAGFKGMKTKVGGLSLDDDVRRVAALRQAIGPDIKLMVDANQAYNAATAIRIGRRLAEHDILWFEEPVSARDMSAYLEVKAALPMEIAGGECLRNRFEFRDFFAQRALDIAQPDVSLAGGISEMRAIATMANAFGIVLNPHVWGSPIMIAASVHVAATIPPCPAARQPQPFAQEPVMEFDRTPSDLREKLCRQAYDQVDGYVVVPQAPGLGVEVDETVLERLCVEHRASRA
jgi:D-galactarolactone cycloisomerase